MLTTSAFAEVAMLVGDPARAAILTALGDGRALTASELASVAGITPQTASGHLARLTQAGLLAMERQGRHRYHRLASPAVAQMLEGIMIVAAGMTPDGGPRRTPPRVGPRDAAMREARTCYDHLAGRIAVAIADRLVAKGHIQLGADGGLLTPQGHGFLAGLGIDTDDGAKSGAKGRVFCRPCLDWSERRPHLAGRLGKALCDACLDRNWMRRMEGSRALTVTPAGRLALRQHFACD